MMSTIVAYAVGFLIQALALKWALGAMGTSDAKNSYSTALGVSLGLSVAGVLLSSIWIVGGLLYLVIWVLVVMNVYEINLSKSLAVGVLQYILRWLLHIVLGMIGFSFVAVV